jgi:peptide/nickel transport system substrate-binding protein
MKKIILKLTIFSILLLSIVGCTKEQKVASINDNDNQYIDEYIIPDGKGNWGYPTPYAFVPRGPGFIRMSYVFDTLIWKDEKGEFIPALAKSWEYNEDENSYVFELQEKAKWHDGQSVTGNDIVFTVNYIKEHPIPWINLKPIETVSVVDDNKVVIKLKEKWAPFYANVAGCMPILPEHIYKNIDKPENFLSEEAIIGSGPYKLASYEAEKGEYVFEAFEDYYLGCPKVKKIKFFKMNPQMQPNALLQGKVDAIFTNGDAEKLFEGKNIKVISDIGMVTKLSFNHNKTPFDNKDFRHAIAYLINTDDIIDIAHRGHAFKANTGIFDSKSMYCEKDVEQYNYNLEKGIKILEDLGYKKGEKYYEKDGNILTFKILGHERVRRDVDLVVEQLNNAGIKAEADYKDIQVADEMLMNSNYDVSIVETGVFGDPIFLNRDILGKSATSDKYYQSERINEILKQQLTITNLEERKELLKELQKVYVEELPSYHLYFSKFVFASNDKVELYFTKDGLSLGVPLALNKMIFVEGNSYE